MTFAPISKMTNALVEISLILASVVLGVIGLPIWTVAIMVGASLVWWSFVHHIRFVAMLEAGLAGALGTLAVALVAMVIGHGIGFALGSAFRAILGLT